MWINIMVPMMITRLCHWLQLTNNTKFFHYAFNLHTRFYFFWIYYLKILLPFAVISRWFRSLNFCVWSTQLVWTAFRRTCQMKIHIIRLWNKFQLTQLTSCFNLLLGEKANARSTECKLNRRIAMIMAPGWISILLITFAYMKKSFASKHNRMSCPRAIKYEICIILSYRLR